ncbi:MAG: tRNA epoxyqueuosine(34) reductase QueG [Leptospiraceae bacterium]|nr:tRNA epoxyqueuosine(34) reductase QueG [Leptospiraceae bacterium]
MMLIDAKKCITLAREAGYLKAGFCLPAVPAGDAAQYRSFINFGRHGTMHWLADQDLRLDPARLLPGVKSIMVLSSWYRDYSSEAALQDASYRVARYAHGRDYHKVLRRKGARLLKQFQQIWPQLAGRVTCDSAPLLEKVYARQAGLGWRGKHTNLIDQEHGSWFFLSMILLNQPVDSLPPHSDPAIVVQQTDHCRDCRLCIEACPTGALQEYQIDARRCLAYRTIEAPFDAVQGQYQDSVVPNGTDWIFGCDICQEVCPWNRNRRSRTRITTDDAFRMRLEIKDLMQGQISTGQDDSDVSSRRADWDAITGGSALKRAGTARLQFEMQAIEKRRNNNA